jgi:hypothetical protein
MSRHISASSGVGLWQAMKLCECCALSSACCFVTWCTCSSPDRSLGPGALVQGGRVASGALLCSCMYSAHTLWAVSSLMSNRRLAELSECTCCGQGALGVEGCHWFIPRIQNSTRLCVFLIRPCKEHCQTLCTPVSVAVELIHGRKQGKQCVVAQHRVHLLLLLCREGCTALYPTPDSDQSWPRPAAGGSACSSVSRHACVERRGSAMLRQPAALKNLNALTCGRPWRGG